MSKAATVRTRGKKEDVKPEVIQGKTKDFLSVAFLDLARAAARSVGRVSFRDGQPLGSGVMVSEHLFLTNNHVIAAPLATNDLCVEFDYELDTKGAPRVVTRFALDPVTFFLTSGEDDLDFTVLAVGPKLDGPKTLEEHGFNPLLGTSNKHMLGEWVNIVQHPQGNFKQVVVRENQLVSRLSRVLHYVADTEPGSSGAPVFNDQWQMVALHHWGGPHAQLVDDAGNPVPAAVNEGIRVSALVQALPALGANLTGAKQALLQELLNSGVTGPSLDLERMPQIGSRTGTVVDPGLITWQLPIEIAVRVPGASVRTQEVPVVVGPRVQPIEIPAIESSSEAVHPDTNYSNRRGYNPDFLPGFVLDLPTMTKAMKGKKAPLLDDNGQFELKYNHFSVVLNRERRMAFFTAANVNGATWKNVDRTTGKVSAHESAETAEASERWFNDPRVASDHQSNQGHYGSQSFRLFDRGHLVRRQDPCWGTNSSAERSNADTFHFSNCTPQVWFFNERSEYWQGIENYILDNAKAEGEKITVITGPVLTEDDPSYRDIHVPRQFFKILVRIENGKPWALALLADQSKWLDKLPERLAEGFDDVDEVAQYQTSIAKVEELTGLDFGSLRNYDAFSGNGEAKGGKRRITTFEALQLRQPGAVVNGTRRLRVVRGRSRRG